MPLMGSLYIGTSGLQTSQNALNTTAHNLTNANTTGYTRQQVQLGTRRYVTLSINPNSVANQQYGLGVSYSRVKQIRDYFLDKTYRKESGRSMFYEVNTDVLENVETQLGELNGEAFQDTLSDFWTAIEELSKDPCSSVTQGMFVMRASEFIGRAAAVYDGLADYQDSLNTQIKKYVNQINQYGNMVLELNERIRAIEAGGIEHANDLRDLRNQILDELGALTNMSWKEDALGNVSIQIEGVDFVKGGMCYEMAMQTDPTNGFVTPFWPQNAKYTYMEDGSKKYNIDGAEVFNLSIEISSDLNTDIGGLKAMLLARGDHRADYTDISNGNYDDISQSILMNIQAEFDQLIHNMVTRINGLFEEAAGVQTGDLELEDGTILVGAKYALDEPGGYLRAEDGSPIQLFQKITTPGYEKVTGKDGNEYWVYVEEDPARQDTLYTLKNLQINQELMQKPAALGFRLPDGSEDNALMEKLKAAFVEEKYTLNPNVAKPVNFIDYYDDLVAQVANSGSVYRSIYTNQEVAVESAFNAREQVVGVSDDEELSNMIKFQNAYNAASRYINVISEMLAHIINTLGV